MNRWFFEFGQLVNMYQTFSEKFDQVASFWSLTAAIKGHFMKQCAFIFWSKQLWQTMLLFATWWRYAHIYDFIHFLVQQSVFIFREWFNNFFLKSWDEIRKIPYRFKEAFLFSPIFKIRQNPNTSFTFFILADSLPFDDYSHFP